jgi:hypothetical protein
MQSACAVWPCVACAALQYFSTCSYKRHDFRKKKILNIKYFFWFSLQLLSETFLILSRIKLDTIINVHKSSCKVPVVLLIFEWNLNSLDKFRKILKYQFSWKSVQWEPSSMRTDRRTGMTKLTVAFRSFPNALNKNIHNMQLPKVCLPHALCKEASSWLWPCILNHYSRESSTETAI